jgi:hypothetical protein
MNTRCKAVNASWCTKRMGHGEVDGRGVTCLAAREPCYASNVPYMTFQLHYTLFFTFTHSVLTCTIQNHAEPIRSTDDHLLIFRRMGDGIDV